MFMNDGGSELPVEAFIKNGQYIRIVGSCFSDGVYVFSDNLSFGNDEIFEGALWEMKPPTSFLMLVEEIAAYNNTEAAKPSPYVSESFAGYSYQKITDYRGKVCTDWQSAFAGKLRRWRKI